MWGRGRTGAATRRSEHRALLAAVLAVPLLLGLAACGETDDGTGQATDASTAGEATDGTTQEIATDDGAASGEQDGEPTDESTDGTSDEGTELPAGEDLPADWPADILVPDGAIVLVLPMGGGYSIEVDGVDSDQAKGIIADMAAAGLTTEGPTDLGNDEWTASATGATHTATYAYATGGAGLPNVLIRLMPVG